MDQDDAYDFFKKLSEAVYSEKSLQQFEAALRVTRARFPNSTRSSGRQQKLGYPSADYDFCMKEQLPIVKPEWAEYAARVSQSEPPREDDELTLSMRNLVNGSYLDVEIVNEYLDILKKSYLSSEVVGIRTLEPGVNLISKEGCDRPTIIPFHDTNNWAFAVAYPDCIHWYDSNPNSVTPQFSASDGRRVVTGWTGPKHSRSEDSGILMLIGIRLLLQGTPHICQTVADQFSVTLRPRIVIELLSKTIDPSQQDFEEILHQNCPPNPSSFFDEAMFHLSPPNRPSQELVADETQSGSEQRKIILNCLSHAVHTNRSTKLSEDKSIATLWLLVQSSQRTSVFHQRHNAVRFYEAMDRLGSDTNTIREALRFSSPSPISKRPADKTIAKMKLIKDQCAFWKDLCELLWDWGDDKFVILSVIPPKVNIKRMSPGEKKDLILEFKQRLEDVLDPLSANLRETQPLVRGLVHDQLPPHSLMIEYFISERYKELTNELYEAFLSIEPSTPQVPIPAL